MKLAVKPTGKAKRALARTGKAKVTAKVTYRTLGGKVIKRTRALVLRKS